MLVVVVVMLVVVVVVVVAAVCAQPACPPHLNTGLDGLDAQSREMSAVLSLIAYNYSLLSPMLRLVCREKCRQFFR